MSKPESGARTSLYLDHHAHFEKALQAFIHLEKIMKEIT
jgi:hypothetical protein